MATEPARRRHRATAAEAEPRREAEPSREAEPRLEVALTPPQILGGFILLAALVLFLRRRGRRS